MADKIKVAVRVRPFNKREIDCNARRVIDMNGQQTLLTALDGDGKVEGVKKFNFDRSYWSVDGFDIDANGISKPKPGSTYIDQETIFQDLGQDMLKNAWDGYNCSIFAYGQTGSGKSYSIMGYGPNKGIVPRICEELFSQIEKKKAGSNVEYQIYFSMTEIYNEKVRDLLQRDAKGRKEELKIRETPQKGFYAEGQTDKAVGSYEDIKLRIDEGNRNRTLAATKMNETSSRAHTIVSILFAQKLVRENVTKSATINLVDLAGSERASQTGATGDRFEESKQINQSLLTLGNVIKGLCEVAKGRQGIPIPYRDSCLTKLLKNTLGGNSRTVMMAAISPAVDNYEQTLSTLRYADRAKSIVNQAMVNEGATDKLIKELIAEKERLLRDLNDAKSKSGAGLTDVEMDHLKAQHEEELQQYKQEIDNSKKAWESRLAQARSEMEKFKDAEEKEARKRKEIPHLWNLNEDPALSGKILIFVNKGKELRIGSRKADPQPDILLSGPSIHKDHAVVSNTKDKVILTPSLGKVYLNGEEIIGEKTLNHQDRVLFGSHNIFVYVDPTQAGILRQQGKASFEITYEMAQHEVSRHFMPGVEEGDEYLLQELITLSPSLLDANACAVELNRNFEFEFLLVSPQARGLREGRSEVMIRLINKDNGNTFLWDRNKFLVRQSVMMELYEAFEESGRATPPQFDQAEDPFWEPPDTPCHVGVVEVPLEFLAYMIQYDEHHSVIDYEGSQMGHLHVELYPCDGNGEEKEYDVVECVDLVGQELNFKLKIHQALNLPKKFYKTWCEYQFYKEKESTRSTDGFGPNAKYAYERLITMSKRKSSQEFLHYVSNSNLVVNVLGLQEAASKPDPSTMLRSKASLGAEEKKQLVAEMESWKNKCGQQEKKLKRIQKVVDNSEKSTDAQVTKIREILDR